MSLITTLGLWFMLGTISVVDPVYPPQAFMGGTVVAKLQFAGSNVKEVTILSGKEPFKGACISALSKWRTSEPKQNEVLAIVHFRQPHLQFIGGGKEKPDPSARKESLPYPTDITSPSYPPNALGQGVVVLRTDISAEGRVTDIQVVRSLGALTDASIEAVRKWQFAPPRDSYGKTASSSAYVVFVYRFILISGMDSAE
jgi:TonB family protein